MTFVGVNTHTHSTTYVADKLLASLQLIVRESGLDPKKISDEWEALERGIATWLQTRHLERLVLEVYDPSTDALVGRWDFQINYEQSGDGTFTLDADQVKYSIKKAGQFPQKCSYRIVASTSPGRPDVEGWSKATFRSTDGFAQHSIGTTIDAGSITAGASYWRKTP